MRYANVSTIKNYAPHLPGTQITEESRGARTLQELRTELELPLSRIADETEFFLNENVTENFPHKSSMR